jgi:hypothetical protein
VFVAALVLVPHALYFNFINDDAYISFRYARNLAEHGELVFNLGERVEGFTNFLWTVLLAVWMKLGIGPELSARLMGIASAIATLFAVNRFTLMMDDGPKPGRWIAPLLLAMSSAYACWSTGGLETQLFTCLSTWGFFYLFRALFSQYGALRGARVKAGIVKAGIVKAGILMALAAMTRPEGMLFFAYGISYAAVFFVFSRPPSSSIRALTPSDLFSYALGFGLLFAPYFVWRWWYFGYPFPNTFYVKASSAGTPLPHGLYYLRRFAEDHLVYLTAPLCLLSWPPRREAHRFRLWWMAVPLITFFAIYTARVGGDFMGLYRFVLPTFPLAALLLQESIRRLGARLIARVPRALCAAALSVSLLAYGALSARLSYVNMTTIGADRGIDTPGYLKHYVDERRPIGQWLAAHGPEGALMTVGGAGVIPYFAIQMRAIDVFGLVDETIAHDPSMTVSARPGHQKWGSDAYMVSRNPIIMTHYYRIHAPHAPNPGYWDARGYEWVTATIPGLKAPPLYSFLKRKDVAFGPFPASQ